MTFVILLVELRSVETFLKSHFVGNTKKFKLNEEDSQKQREEENDKDKTKIDNYLV